MVERVTHDVLRADGETIGRVVWDGTAWRPETVFGAILSAPESTSEAAARSVREHGLRALMEPWWVRRGSEDWRQGWLQEVRTDRVRVSWSDPKYVQPDNSDWVDVGACEFRREPPE